MTAATAWGRRAAAALSVVVVAAIAVGCASNATPPKGPSSAASSATAAATHDPLQLVGSWKLDAPGQEAGSVLRLGDDLTLWTSCGVLVGDWKADTAGLFAAVVAGFSGSCTPRPGDPTPSWLARAVAFRTSSSGAELLDASGKAVATLRPGGHPTPRPDIAPELAEPPARSSQLRAKLREPAPLPSGLRPAKPADLIGSWIPPDKPTPRGYITLSADGSWQGSDGANGYHGRWSAAPDGAIVVTAGASTLIGCAPPSACANVPSWLIAASRAGFDGSTLVFVDATGKTTGRLIRGTPSSAPAAAASS